MVRRLPDAEEYGVRFSGVARGEYGASGVTEAALRSDRSGLYGRVGSTPILPTNTMAQRQLTCYVFIAVVDAPSARQRTRIESG